MKNNSFKIAGRFLLVFTCFGIAPGCEKETVGGTSCQDFSQIPQIDKSSCPKREEVKQYLYIPKDIRDKYRCPSIKSVDSEGEKISSGECCYQVTINTNSDKDCPAYSFTD